MPDSNLHNTEAQLSLLKQISNAIDAIIYSKDLQGNYTYINESALELFQCSADKVIGSNASHFFDEDSCQNINKTDQEVFQKSNKITYEHTNCIKGTDKKRIYQTIKNPVFDEQGNVIGLCGISTDITKEKHLEATVDEQKQLLHTVLDNVEAHVYMKNEDRQFLYVNSKVANRFGLPASEIVGRYETDLLPPKTAQEFHQNDREVFQKNKVLRRKETVTTPDGEELHYLTVKAPVWVNNKRAIIGFSSDVTEIYRMKEQFKLLANTDYLTNLYNRRFFTVQGEREFSRAKRHKAPFAIISVDIDHFKKINDDFGHPAGDQVLKTVSQLLLKSIRKEDILARIGGEEFTIILPETTLKSANALAERTRECVQNEIIAHSKENKINVTVSLGVTLLTPEDKNFDDVLIRVDEALYEAKENGRNQVCCL
jgi:diguanylate cyclase (GGDEF)-like protein/PAS domain S-box-containing protein